VKHTLLHIGLARLATESRKTAWTYDINTDTISSISQISADQSNKCILKSHWAALFWYNNESGHVNYTRQCPRAAWWCSRRIAKSETCEVSFSNVENTFLADCDNWWPRNHFLMTATPAATLGSSMWPGSSTTLIFWQTIWKDCLHSLQLKEIDEIVSVFMSYALAVYLDSVANLQTYDECAIICNFSSISADQSNKCIQEWSKTSLFLHSCNASQEPSASYCLEWVCKVAFCLPQENRNAGSWSRTCAYTLNVKRRKAWTRGRKEVSCIRGREDSICCSYQCDMLISFCNMPIFHDFLQIHL